MSKKTSLNYTPVLTVRMKKEKSILLGAEEC